MSSDQSGQTGAENQNLLRRCRTRQRLRRKAPAPRQSQLCRCCEKTEFQKFSAVDWDGHCIPLRGSDVADSTRNSTQADGEWVVGKQKLTLAFAWLPDRSLSVQGRLLPVIGENSFASDRLYNGRAESLVSECVVS